MDAKVCCDCGELKPLEEFSPSSKNRDGRVSYCRPCLALRHRTYQDVRRGSVPRRRSLARASSPDVKWCPKCQQELARVQFGRNRSSSDGLTAYCRPCHNATSRASYERLYGSTRDYHLRRRYGLTSADVDALIEAQGGVCAVCRRRAPTHVDHDHATGQVRGVLCSGCNQGLGNFTDDAQRLRAAADYVALHSWQHVRVDAGVHRMVPPRSSAGV